jgi:hypothetical protein
MTWCRRVVILTLGLAVAVAAVARDARADDIDRHIAAGVLLPKGIRTFSARPTLGGDLTKVWSPADHLELGFEAGVAVTSLPYGRSDGPGMITYNDNHSDSLTLLPRLMFGPRFVPTSNVCLGVSVGTTWLWSGASTELAFVPFPTASVAVETWFGPDARFGLRASFSYMHYWFGNGNDALRNALLAPSLAFAWAN